MNGKCSMCDWNLHWLAVTTLLEDLWGHVSRRTACGGQHVELLLVHDPGQPEIRNQKVCIVFRGAEQQVLRLQITVNDPVVMKIGHGREDGANEVCGVGLVVAALATDAIEQLSAEGQIGN